MSKPVKYFVRWAWIERSIIGAAGVGECLVAYRAS